MEAIVFTDGASRGNPGPGGWGTIIVLDVTAPRSDKGARVLRGGDSEVFELGGFEPNTTNNRMELQAAISALTFLEEKLNSVAHTGVNESIKKHIQIYTDSKYVLRGSTEWLAGWEQKGWKTMAKQDVSNKDLWLKMSVLLDAVGMENMSWKLLSGHVGIVGNERADKIATSFALGKPDALFSGTFEKYQTECGFDILNVSHDFTKKEKKSSSKTRSSAKAFSYVSMVDGLVQTHKTWAECEARVKGKAALYKKATSPAEESEIISHFQTKKSY